MKTILIPTDFSDSSMNAACYAISLAKQLNSKVILLHIFHIPVVPSEAPVIIVSYEELEKDNMLLMKNFETELRAKTNYEKEIVSIVKPGFVTDELKDVVTEEQVDLIVMGIKGTNKLNEIVIGSNTTSTIKNVDCPTLVIPTDVAFKPVKNIAFACDMDKIEESRALNQIKSLVSVFNSKLMIINVVEHSEKPTFEKALSGVKLENVFESIDHTLHFPEDDDLVFAINDFIDKHAIDLLIMMPRKHSFFGNLFHKSNTKKMAFHTHIPLLAIHE
jgi:nucleotide-binding universal stress UspA family protein